MSPLAGRRILVVEDEFLVALEASAMLSEVGVTVVGPAYHAEKALKYAQDELLDAALLDINLGSSTSERVADCLRKRGIPVVFATGYGQLAGVEGSGLVIDKPYSQADLVAALSSVLA